MRALAAAAVAGSLVLGSLMDLPAAAPAAAAQGAQVTLSEFGVPMITAEDPVVMAEAFGHAQAVERLVQLDVLRHLAQGRLSELLGESAYAADVVMRREHYDRVDVDRQLAAQPAHLRALLAAYSDGVNRAREEVLADPTRTPALLAALAHVPEAWTPHDSVSVLNLFTAVTFAAEGEGDELANATLYQQLQQRYGAQGDRVFDDVRWSRDPGALAVIQRADEGPRPDGVTEPAKPAAAQLAIDEELAREAAAALRADGQALAAVTELVPVPKVGSYAMAVAGTRTASGGAVLLGAPQAGFFFPSVFHEVALDVPGWRCAGMTVPGIGPFIGIGWCNDHAWTLVAGNSGDQVDVYVERYADPDGDAYRWKGVAEPFRTRTETFVVRSTVPAPSASVRQETFRYSRHGAVFAEDASAGVAFTTRRAQAGRFAENLTGLYALNTGTDGSAGILRDAVPHLRATYNLTFADRQGSIGYALTGLQPLRATGHDRRFPMPGDGSAEWRGFIGTAQMPHVVNPVDGVLAVNQGVESLPVSWWPASSWAQIGSVNRVGATRAVLAGGDWTLDRLEQANRRAVETQDPFMPMLSRYVDEALAGQDDLAGIAALWAEWKAAGFTRVDRDGDGAYDAPGAAVFSADGYYNLGAPSPMWSRLVQEVFADELPRGLPSISLAQLSTLRAALDRAAPLRLSRDYVDDVRTPQRETRVALVRRALRAALGDLAERYGSSDASQWRLPYREIGYTAFSVSAPQPLRTLDHGTYSFLVDLGRQEARSILPPGNDGADSAGEEVSAQISGAFPRHAVDQRELYEQWRFKALRRPGTEKPAAVAPQPADVGAPADDPSAAGRLPATGPDAAAALAGVAGALIVALAAARARAVR